MPEGPVAPAEQNPDCANKAAIVGDRQVWNPVVVYVRDGNSVSQIVTRVIGHGRTKGSVAVPQQHTDRPANGTVVTIGAQVGYQQVWVMVVVHIRHGD